MLSSDNSDFEDVGGESFEDMDETPDDRNATEQGRTNVNGKKVKGPNTNGKIDFPLPYVSP